MKKLRFQKLDNHRIPHNKEEIRGFICIRNEMLRLPWVLEHHRRIGVNRFFVIDNGSTDGSTEYLLTQNDVHCFHTTDRYSDSNWGLTWINFILNSFGVGNWCLIIDADEMFVYPSFEVKQLLSFLKNLDRLGVGAVLSLVIDMYSSKPIKKTFYKSGEPFIKACPYFDSETYRGIKTPAFPPIQVYGGPRERVFWAKNDIDFHSPTMSVVPMVKWQEGFAYTCGRHCISPAMNISIFSGAVLHFKFFHDFYDRIEMEVARGEHFSGAREYQVYLNHITNNPDLNLYYVGSKLFKDSKQLVDLNLIRDL